LPRGRGRTGGEVTRLAIAAKGTRRTKKRLKQPTLCVVFARLAGSVMDLPGGAAAADSGFVGLADDRDFIALPQGSLLLTLPGRSVTGYAGSVRSTASDSEGEICAVAAALPLGY